MTIGIGLVGCGAWGRHILRDLKSCGATVHVVARSDASRRNATSHGADSIVQSLSALPPVDGYIVAAPSSLHAEIISVLLPSGRPIFTEKPMTTDVPSAQRIADVADGRVFVMDKWRYHPAIERLRREIADGTLGDLLSIRIQRWGWGCPHTDVTANWVLMPHDLSILLHWLGQIPPLLWARPAVDSFPQLGAVVHLGGERGPFVTIDMSIAGPEHRRIFTVTGTKATMELRDSYDPEIQVRRGPPGDADARIEKIEVGREMPLLLEIQAFLAHIAGGRPPMSSARDGLLIVKRVAEIEAATLAAARR